jgi:predicted lipoprotein with Yx(FWY)xxD motif
MTLYKLSADSAGTSVCTGTCASVWPPLTVPAGTTPKGGPGASAAFGTITRADGTVQVTYAGHPVYTFSGDSSAGATSGNNIMSFGGTWTVLSAGTGATPAKNTTATTKAPSGGGYGY